MPQFAFQATDSNGNRIEGNAEAEDAAAAVKQIAEMGYSLLNLSAAGQGTTANDVESVANKTLTPASQPVKYDLTNSMAAWQAEADTTTGKLEPWQRGGAVEPPAPVTPTVQLAAAPAYPAQPSQEYSRPRERFRESEIPYLSGIERKSTPLQIVKDRLIYPIYSGVVLKDMAPFLRQFATLINAGLPLYQALIGLEKNTQNSRLKEIAREGQRQVQAGGRFSDVMAAYPWIFSMMQVQVIRASEEGGMLDESLKHLANYLEHDLEMRRLISRETLYPKIVVFFALMILGQPGFIGQQMSIVKLVLGGMGQTNNYGLGNYLMETVGFGFFCLLPILVGVAVFRLFLYNMHGVREGYHAFKIMIPGIGKLIRMFAVAKFMRTYAALYRTGFGVGSALTIAGDACGNWVMRNAAHRAVHEAEHGMLVSEALARAGRFPSMAIDMFRTGETSGSLDQMLDKVADYYESEGKLKSHQYAMIFSVIIFLIVAILVGVQIISFYTGYGAAVKDAGN